MFTVFKLYKVFFFKKRLEIPMKLISGVLDERLELNERNSVETRKNILKSYDPKLLDETNFTVVIFDGEITLEVYVTRPNCGTKHFDKIAVEQLIPGLSPEEITDKLANFYYLSLLDDEKIITLKKIFDVELLEDLTNLIIFFHVGTYCNKHHMTFHQKKIIFELETLPESENFFCWLQILPIVKAYPSNFLTIDTECKIHEIKAFTNEYSIITEISNKNPSLEICLDMKMRPEENKNSFYLYNNKTEFDILCIYNQCVNVSKKIKQTDFRSYRLRFLKFLVEERKAGMTYMSEKLLKHENNGKFFLWYR